MSTGLRLSGKVAIVTGAARGMGAAETLRFAAEGAVVHAVDIREQIDHLPNQSVSNRGSIRPHRADISSESDWAKLMAEIERESGGVDVLINNAGIQGSASPVHELGLDEWKRILDVNQTGSMLGFKYAIPAMKRRGGGSIVQVSSVFASRGVSGLSAYSATKAAVAGLARNAAITYVKDNIRVNSLHPGLIDTPLIAEEAPMSLATLAKATPMLRAGTATEVAAAALFLASDEASFITGIELYVDGGYTAFGQ